MAEKKKMGRPTLYGEQAIKVQLRFDEETLRELDELCAKENRTRSNMMRHLIRKEFSGE